VDEDRIRALAARALGEVVEMEKKGHGSPTEAKKEMSTKEMAKEALRSLSLS
jgi:hypothetical protein